MLDIAKLGADPCHSQRMNTKSARLHLAGGLLLIVGGLLSAIGASVFRFGPSTPGSWITIGGALFDAVAFIACAVGFRQTAGLSVGRRTLVAAGTFGVIWIALAAIAESAQQGLPTPSLVSEVLEMLLLLVAAIAIRASSAVVGPLSWALLPAAIWGAIDLVLYLTGVGGQWFTLVLSGILFIVAGAAICAGVARRVVARAVDSYSPRIDEAGLSSQPESP
jgi:hypothetical protein